MTGEKADRAGGDGRGNGGALPTSDDAGRMEKSTPESRTLEIDHLDRTEGYDDAHYSWREVAKACHSSGGTEHE